jgi:hypothetical protein
MACSEQTLVSTPCQHKTPGHVLLANMAFSL